MQFGKLSGISRVYGERRVRGPEFEMGDYHYHSFYELYYVEKGACQFFVQDSLFRMRQGEFILIAPEQLHYTKYRESCQRFSVYFRKEDVENAAEGILGDTAGYSHRLFSIPAAWQSELHKLLERMEQEERREDAYSPAAMRLILNELLLLCLRFGLFSSESPEELYSEDAGILQAARYITQHYGEKLSQQRLSEISGYSPNYFSKRFKETTGIGAHEYLRLIRLKNAAELLRGTERSVLDIALSVGFSDGNYFKDAFKGVYGSSPREYRRGK